MKNLKQLTQIIKEVYDANFDEWADTEGEKHKICFQLNVSSKVVDSEDLKGALKENKLSHLHDFIKSEIGLVDAYLHYGIGYYRGTRISDEWHEPPILLITFWFDNIEIPNQIIKELGIDTELLTLEDL